MSVPCPNCGRLNREGARFCATCQTPLGQLGNGANGSEASGTTAAGIRLQPGQLLAGGAYRVVRPLGKGGMGAVWLVAQTRAFDRLAVLKEVIDYFDPLDPDERRRAAERFEAEARTLGALKHPGIPDLYAYFSEGSHPGSTGMLRNYLVMEYIEGHDLRTGLTRSDTDTGALVEGGPLPPDQVLRYTIQICEVLEYLAACQPPVVHNDVKPGNIIVDSHSGRAVLVDFGTAKTRYLRPSTGPDRAKDSVYGTVGYAAPELYRGYSEPRSDVYSLAATAYHLLTDDDPRDHPGRYPQLETGQVPPALADILRAALAEDVEERLTAARFRQRLERYLSGRAEPVPPSGATGIATAPGQAEPPGEMKLVTESVRLLELAPGQQVQATIRVANQGRGTLRGEALVTEPWLSVSRGFACPPGQECAIPVAIDTTDLVPEQVYVGAVTLTPGTGQPEVVPVQVASLLPAIEVAPTRVDFGTVSRSARRAPRQRLAVTNVGRVVARCQVGSAPPWLHAGPRAFEVQPGQQQFVELMVDLSKVAGRRNEAALTLALLGGPERRVEVSVQVRGGGWFG